MLNVKSTDTTRLIELIDEVSYEIEFEVEDHPTVIKDKDLFFETLSSLLRALAFTNSESALDGDANHALLNSIEALSSVLFPRNHESYAIASNLHLGGPLLGPAEIQAITGEVMAAKQLKAHWAIVSPHKTSPYVEERRAWLKSRSDDGSWMFAGKSFDSAHQCAVAMVEHFVGASAFRTMTAKEALEMLWNDGLDTAPVAWIDIEIAIERIAYLRSL